ncbi:MAG: radical SAM protein [Deltaproteobacteria bacterium]|nr:radical SAM protein [Deltaproteobacteria bacterium]
MKVLLINPPYEGNINTWTPESTNRAIGAQPPIGIAYLAAMLEKEKIKVSILDANALGLGTAGIKEAIRKANPDIVGITAMTLISINAVAVAKISKEVSKAVTVVGGPHITLFPRETLESNAVDYAMDGEAEYTFLEFVKAMKNGEPVDKIEGMVYRKDGKVHVNKIAIVDDLDSLPFPAVHLLPLDHYSLANAKNPFGSIVTSRGCPFKCKFCIRGPIDNRVRFRDPKNVVDEIEFLIKDFKVREINIRNDTVTVKKSHIYGICEEIIRRNLKIRWQGPTRVDCIDREMLLLMKKAGCHTVRYGIESGNDSVLERMGKGTSLKQIRDAVRWTKEAGIEIMAYFMVGYIDETEKEIMDTIKFAKEINPDGAIFSIGTPLPNTELFYKAVERGIIEESYWRDFVTGRRYDRAPYLVKDAEQWAKKALWSFYFRPSYIVKRLKKIDSWDAFRKHAIGAYSFLRFKMNKQEPLTN